MLKRKGMFNGKEKGVQLTRVEFPRAWRTHIERAFLESTWIQSESMWPNSFNFSRPSQRGWKIGEDMSALCNVEKIDNEKQPWWSW